MGPAQTPDPRRSHLPRVAELVVLVEPGLILLVDDVELGQQRRGVVAGKRLGQELAAPAYDHGGAAILPVPAESRTQVRLEDRLDRQRPNGARRRQEQAQRKREQSRARDWHATGHFQARLDRRHRRQQPRP